jgi:hypothetical protein
MDFEQQRGCAHAAEAAALVVSFVGITPAERGANGRNGYGPRVLASGGEREVWRTDER